MLITALGDIVLSSSAPNSPNYFWSYLIFQTAVLLTEVAVVRELFSLTMSEYPGIRTAARWMMYGALSVSAVSSFVLTTAFWGGGANGRSGLFYVLVLNRSIQFSLAVVVISFLVFLSHYPLHLHRNLYVSANFFGALFLMEAADSLVATLSPHLYSNLVDTTVVLLTSVLLAGWAGMLRASEAVAVAPAFDAPGERQLLLQLESLNNTLSRAGRRQ
ncbi:MAG: hypothetical protein ABUS49_02285 [Acidobacteriota bacterium]